MASKIGTRAKGWNLCIFPLVFIIFFVILWYSSIPKDKELDSTLALLGGDGDEARERRWRIKDERKKRAQDMAEMENSFGDHHEFERPYCVNGHIIPTLFLLGCAKCGSTRTVQTLVNSIEGLSMTSHPATFIQGRWRWFSRKELYFLGEEHPGLTPAYPSDEDMRFSQFGSYYPNCSVDKEGHPTPNPVSVTIEGTPTTFVFYDDALRRFRRFWGPDVDQLLFVFSLCDPVHATESHYRMLMSLDGDPADWVPFHLWVDQMMLWFSDKRSYPKPAHATSLTNNLYLDFLVVWFDEFRPDQFLVTIMEDETGLQSLSEVVAERLQLPLSSFHEGIKNEGLGSITFSEKEKEVDDIARDRLIKFFVAHNKNLYDFLEKSGVKVFGLELILNTWKSEYTHVDNKTLVETLEEEITLGDTGWHELLDFMVVVPIALSQIYSVLLVYHLVCYIFFRITGRDEPEGKIPAGTPPTVTIQILCCDEGQLVRKTIDAACSLDWPVESLYVQVLDDSRELLTTEIVDKAVAEWSEGGVHVSAIRRSSRYGFKAGNLKNGMNFIEGEFVLYIDADFRLSKDAISAMVSLFYDEQGAPLEDVALVQCPWSYYNQSSNFLTKATALEMDYHFVISQFVRSQLFGFFGFNGTAGMWRKSAIEHAGGWECDTLAEDMDLSVRCLGLGYTFRFSRQHPQDSELPALVSSFQSQRYRWTKGFSQNLRKSWRKILSADIPIIMKLDTFILLTSNLGSVIGLYAIIWSPWLVMMYQRQKTWLSLFLLWPVFASLIALLVVAIDKPFRSSTQTPSLLVRISRSLLAIPLICIGAANCLNLSLAFFDGLFSNDTFFVVTPKEGDIALPSLGALAAAASRSPPRTPSRSTPSRSTRFFFSCSKIFSSVVDFLTITNPFVLAFHVNMLTVLEMMIILFLSFSILYLLKFSVSTLPFCLLFPLFGFIWMVGSKIKMVWDSLSEKEETEE